MTEKELIDLEAGMMQMYQGARALEHVSSDLERSFQDFHLQLKKSKLENDLADQKLELLNQFQKVLDLISQGADGLRWMKTTEFEKDLKKRLHLQKSTSCSLKSFKVKHDLLVKFILELPTLFCHRQDC